ncbi:MAG TPA: hypothetical protein VFE47_12605 [Tepidisphaeraceae bacterium]|jgi:hypothetical protein|nr:hypothetical protein [Tepidisphaeraceae bacterium]
MARPIYILCAQGTSEDRTSGSITIFGVIEKLRISKTAHPAMMPLLQMRVVAAWAREENDIGRDFEWSVEFRTPTGAEVSVGSGKFTFESPNCRINANIVGQMPIEGTGTLMVTAKIRSVGKGEWSSQEYPIIVDELTQEEFDQMVNCSSPMKVMPSRQLKEM